MNHRLWIIALILFINALGNGLILPLLPFFAISMHASPIVIGLLIATLPLFATLSGPPLGALSDRYGRRPVLLLSIASTVVGLILLGLAQSLPILFLARIVEGAAAGNTATARAAIADITPEDKRTSGIGLTFAAESLGLILGPVIGGIFSQYGLSLSAYIATAIALVCLLLTFFFFPETHPRTLQAMGSHKLLMATRGHRAGDFLKVAVAPQTRALVFVVFAVQLLVMMMWGSLALLALDLYGFGALELGYVSAFAACIGISAQTGLLRFLTVMAEEKTILVTSLVAMSAGLVFIAISNSPVLLLVGIGVMAASFNIAMPTAMGFVSRLTTERDQGNAMGTMSSATSLASVIGPIVAGALYGLSMRGGYFVASAIALLAAMLSIGGIVVTRSAATNKPNPDASAGPIE